MVALMAIGAEAQVTWNVRAGGGVIEDYYGDPMVSARIFVQSNIPISGDKRWVFSPTFGFASEFSGSYHIDLPLYMGYKIPIGERTFFVPKIGPVLGIEANSGTFIAGPSVEFSFEIDHFVIAASGYCSLVKSYYYNTVYDFSLTLGYKF